MRRWIFVQGPKSRVLFRAHLVGRKGKIIFGNEVAIDYRRQWPGRLSFVSDKKISSFKDGQVLIRHKKNFRVARRRLPGFPLMISLALLCILRIPTEEKVLEPNPRSVPLKIALPSSIAVNKERSMMPTSKPSLNWKESEQKARQAFIRGRFDRALEELWEVKLKNRGVWPRELRKLVAEIEFAQCRKAFDAQEWRGSVVACEEANQAYAHPGADAILAKLGVLSRRSFLEGYVMEAINKKLAIARYKQAYAMAPASSPYRQKASQKLKALKVVSHD